MTNRATTRLALCGIDYPHAAAYRATLTNLCDVEVVGFYDPHPSRSRRLLEPHLADLPIYSDPAELIARHHPDAAMVSVPHDVRPALLGQLVDAGVHIWVEKPGATSSAVLKELSGPLERNGLQFYTGYIRRFHPCVLAIKDAVDRGLLGDLTLLQLRYITSSVTLRDPKSALFSRQVSGGGILHWLGCHFFDLARFVTSRDVVDVMGYARNLSAEAIDVESVASVAMSLDGGMVGTFTGGYVYPTRSNDAFLGLYGTLGWAEWNFLGSDLAMTSTHPDWFPAGVRKTAFAIDALPGHDAGNGVAELRSWIRAVRGEGPAELTIHDAIKTLEIIEACYESSATGQRIVLS